MGWNLRPSRPSSQRFDRPWTWPSCVCALCWWSASLGKNLGLFFGGKTAWEKPWQNKMWFALETPRTNKITHMAKNKESFFWLWGRNHLFFVRWRSFLQPQILRCNRDIHWDSVILFGRYQVSSAHYRWDNCDPRRASDVRWTKSPLNGDMVFTKYKFVSMNQAHAPQKKNKWLKICLPRFDILRTFDPLKCLSWIQESNQLLHINYLGSFSLPHFD